MRRVPILLAGALALAAQIGLAFDASAQQVFVSAQRGRDANHCTLAFPCRTFARALSAVPAGGEIVVLDSGGYGAMTINKSVRVNAPPGVYAGVSNPAGGIVVTIGPTDVVALEGLTITSLPPNTGTGIEFSSGGSLILDRCLIDGWFDGIDVDSPGTLVLEGTTVRDCFRSGLTSRVSTGSAAISIQHCAFESTSQGVALDIGDGTIVNMSESHLTENRAGLQTSPAAGKTAEVNVSACQVSDNFEGILTVGSGGVATVRVANSIITDNGFGLTQADPSIVESQGNNLIRGNLQQDKRGNITLITGD